MPHIKNVNRKKGGNRYCGPSAISAITKLDTDQAAALIRQAYGRRTIKGSSVSEVWAVLRLCGYRVGNVTGQTLKTKPTLARWLAANKAHRTPGRVFLLVAGNHFQLIEGRRYVCGIVGEVVSVKHEKVKRRARVTQVYEVVGDYQHPAEALAKIESAKAKRKAVLNKDAPLKRKVLQAQREGLVEWDYWDDRTYPPSIIYPGSWWRDAEVKGIADPYEGDHDGGDWAGAAQLVETYRAIRSKL